MSDSTAKNKYTLSYIEVILKIRNLIIAFSRVQKYTKFAEYTRLYLPHFFNDVLLKVFLYNGN